MPDPIGNNDYSFNDNKNLWNLATKDFWCLGAKDVRTLRVPVTPQYYTIILSVAHWHWGSSTQMFCKYHLHIMLATVWKITLGMEKYKLWYFLYHLSIFLQRKRKSCEKIYLTFLMHLLYPSMDHLPSVLKGSQGPGWESALLGSSVRISNLQEESPWFLLVLLTSSPMHSLDILDNLQFWHFLLSLQFFYHYFWFFCLFLSNLSFIFFHLFPHSLYQKPTLESSLLSFNSPIRLTACHCFQIKSWLIWW